MITLIVVNFSFLTGSWSSAILLVAWGIVLALHYLYLRRMERAEADRGRDGQAGRLTLRPSTGGSTGGR